MFEENKEYLVSTKYLYYILGSGSYNEKVGEILTTFIQSMQVYREHSDYEFDYYVMNGSDLNYLNLYYNLENIEIVDKKKRLIREVI